MSWMQAFSPGGLGDLLGRWRILHGMGPRLRRKPELDPSGDDDGPPPVARKGKRSPRQVKTAKSKAVQYAALPYRTAETGDVEVLLITSRETRRWVIPKGWPMKDRPPHEAAATEALEEAGAIGEPHPEPVGDYSYAKVLKSGQAAPIRVTVYPLRVIEMAENWKEQGQRELRWFGYEEAALQVAEEELQAVIRSFGQAGRGRL